MILLRFTVILKLSKEGRINVNQVLKSPVSNFGFYTVFDYTTSIKHSFSPTQDD